MNWAEIGSKVRIHDAGRLRAGGIVQLVAAIYASKFRKTTPDRGAATRQ